MLIHDFKFEPKISDEAMAKAKECLKGLNSDRGSRTNFFVVYDNGDSSKFFNQGCHYSIGHGQACNGKRALVVTEGNGWNRRHFLTRDDALPFATYLTQTHHLSRFILNRDNLDECLDYGYIISGDIPAPWLQNFCIMTRHFFEVEACAFKKFNQLLSDGVDPDLAYLVTMNAGYSLMAGGTAGEGRLVDNFAITSYGGHRAVRMLPLDAMENFMKGKTRGEFKTVWRDDQVYNGGSMMYDPKVALYNTKVKSLPDSLLADKDFKERLSAYRKESTTGAMYRPPNPFAKKDPFAASTINGEARSGQITCGEFFAVAVPYVNELVKGWKQDADDSRAIAA